MDDPSLHSNNLTLKKERIKIAKKPNFPTLYFSFVIKIVLSYLEEDIIDTIV